MEGGPEEGPEGGVEGGADGCVGEGADGGAEELDPDAVELAGSEAEGAAGAAGAGGARIQGKRVKWHPCKLHNYITSSPFLSLSLPLIQHLHQWPACLPTLLI